MSKYQSATTNCIHSMCRRNGLNVEEIYGKSKVLLKTYREVCWAASARAEELCSAETFACGGQLSTALTYLAEFAPDTKREIFEDRTQSLFETRWLTELVEDTMCRVHRFFRDGELYYRILHLCYFDTFVYSALYAGASAGLPRMGSGAV